MKRSGPRSGLPTREVGEHPRHLRLVQPWETAHDLPVLDVARPLQAGPGQAGSAPRLDLASRSWHRAVDTLGIDYAPSAFRVAQQLCREAPELLVAGTDGSWVAAVIWVIAEDVDAFGVRVGERADFARELGSTVRALRAMSRVIRTRVEVLDLRLPAAVS